ncbi:c-type cytochrome [Seonamhaeicola sp. ML3]|uniref:c-type cytochrome n=1 Tax=Seonamhaeicola sp. ML3 TaxID=2937786 RepID=UPI00200FC49E|nr:c-type cytochrome [Seonamhaeicola sp. ML3]
MKKIAFIFSLVVILGFTIIILVWRVNRTEIHITKDPQPICGNERILNDEQQEGKIIFNINCASCHQLKGNVDPPLLQNNFKNYTLERFQKFVTNEERNRENVFGNVECMSFPKLTEQKIEYVYRYITYSLSSE